MLDETIITETPPLYSCYGHIGQQVRVPITGHRAKRILHGAINVRTGDVAALITKAWTQEEHQDFLSVIRSHWRGWNIVLFEDRASQHTAPDSLDWAESLGIEVRLLPKATPELNADFHGWEMDPHSGGQSRIFPGAVRCSCGSFLVGPKPCFPRDCRSLLSRDALASSHFEAQFERSERDRPDLAPWRRRANALR